MPNAQRRALLQRSQVLEPRQLLLIEDWLLTMNGTIDQVALFCRLDAHVRPCASGR